MRRRLVHGGGHLRFRFLVHVGRRACVRCATLSRRESRDHACPRRPRSILGIHDRYTCDTYTLYAHGAVRSEASVDRMRRSEARVIALRACRRGRAAPRRAGPDVDGKTRGHSERRFPRETFRDGVIARSKRPRGAPAIARNRVRGERRRAENGRATAPNRESSIEIAIIRIAGSRRKRKGARTEPAAARPLLI